MVEVTKEDFSDWLRHPVTQAWQQYLVNLRERGKEEWAQEGYLSENRDATLQRNAAGLARVQLLAALVDVDWAELMEGLSYGS